MEFASPGHEACYKKTARMLKELFGESANPNQHFPQWAIFSGSAMVTVTVYPWDDNDAALVTQSCLVTDVEITPELMHFLLRESYNTSFGAFSLDEEEDIWFSHTIVGSRADKEELRASIMAVLHVADKYDDEIVSRFGGQRAEDR